MKDGGPAFPHETVDITHEKREEGENVGSRFAGMSLRDYFAAAALQGYRCAYWQWYERVGKNGEFAEPQELAKWSYADADAMLAQREKE